MSKGGGLISTPEGRFTHVLPGMGPHRIIPIGQDAPEAFPYACGRLEAEELAVTAETREDVSVDLGTPCFDL